MEPLYLGRSEHPLRNDPAGDGRPLRPRGASLIGVDLKKDRETVLAAYDDRDGVTARFNRNLLARINRELGGDFGIDTFEHQALERGGLDLQQFADLATATGWCLGPVWTDSKDRSAVVALIANG
jgi:hypothetical protein